MNCHKINTSLVILSQLLTLQFLDECGGLTLGGASGAVAAESTFHPSFSALLEFVHQFGMTADKAQVSHMMSHMTSHKMSHMMSAYVPTLPPLPPSLHSLLIGPFQF